MNEDSAIDAFSVLSNRTRLRILRMLVAAGPDGLSAGDIAKHVDASPSRASFHLAAMTSAALVASERQARQVVYKVRFETVGAMMRYVLEDCCRNNEVVRSCCTGTGKC